MKNLAIAAAIAVYIAMYFASATARASLLIESTAEIDAKQQRNQMAQSSIMAAKRVIKLCILFYCMRLVFQI